MKARKMQIPPLLYKIFATAPMENARRVRICGTPKKEPPMQVASNSLVNDPAEAPDSTANKRDALKTVEVLEVLLAHSIYLRDLYGNARWQTAAAELRRLRQLFDGHHKQQIHLIDVLIDRIRALNGGGPFARDFIDRTRSFQILRGRASTRHLLVELVDAHESVLSAALPAGTHYGQVSSWTRDFAVGQVVLTNDQQILAVRNN
jgi:DNA-binding ferritin-like protein